MRAGYGFPASLAFLLAAILAVIGIHFKLQSDEKQKQSTVAETEDGNSDGSPKSADEKRGSDVKELAP